tara:strand:+ start:381 stop:995 length:615 start_codon:yes stop_codon:yes gene_type:complete
MIYEFRTYQIKSGSLPIVLEKFEEKIDGRNNISKIGAFWFTEIGPLNQIIHVWPYDNIEHRNNARQEAVEKKLWPPDTSEYMVSMNSEIWKPAPFSPSFTDREIGPFFEMRMYTFEPEQIDKILGPWEEKLEARNNLAPLVGAFISEIGDVNKFMHIWGYKSLQHRTEAREKFSSIGWPPKSNAKPPLKMENKIVMAANFSPIK